MGRVAASRYRRPLTVAAAVLALAAADMPTLSGRAPASGQTRTIPETPTTSARALVDKAIAAKGGQQKLQSIRTIRSEATTAYETPQGRVPFATTTWIEYPDRYRIEAAMPGGKVVQVYAKGQYWIQDAQGTHEAPSAETVRASLQRDTIPLLLKLAAGQLDAHALETKDPALAALQIAGRDMAPLTMFVNRDTGFIAGVRYQDQSGTATEELYSDYRDVDGVQIAFHTVVRREGLSPVERDVKTFRMNVPVPRNLFTKPS